MNLEYLDGLFDDGAVAIALESGLLVGISVLAQQHAIAVKMPARVGHEGILVRKRARILRARTCVERQERDEGHGNERLQSLTDVFAGLPHLPRARLS